MIVRVLRSCVIDAPVDIVWPLLRDFNSHARWHPAIAASHIEGGEPPDHVGAVRAFRLRDGGFLREQLIALSDRDMSLSYCLLEAPVRLDGYVATMRLRRVTEGERTFLQWQSRFDSSAGEADALARLVGETIYEVGMAALQARLRRATGALVPAPRPVVPPPSSPLTDVERSGARPLPVLAALQTNAIVIERHGGPEVLIPRRVDVPPPGPGEVRLRHLAIGVNMVDLHGRAGDFGLDILPAIPGMEAAGVVLDVGPGVTHLAAGDPVVYACSPPGAYAEARTMPASMVVLLPPDIAPETAAAVFLKGITADLLLHDVHPLRAGESVLVHAAAGGLGLLLCGWARALGARVIGVVSSDAKAEAAIDAGAAHAVVGGRQDVAAAVRELTGGRGIDVVYDGIGQASFEISLASLARRGHLVSHGQVSGPVGLRDIDSLATKSVRLSRPNFLHFTETAEDLRRRADRLFEALRQGQVRPRIDRRLPLSDAAAAHRRLESRQNIGSIVLIP
ncbi:MAG TPA: zinc-binding dehydrogenase [Lichenihabitans sp.]|jgi:NADPH:quinone reductase-like Zn-dependent oxidoreductase|nr:zinc-binding dehydrogenase [Lichenihabitans sp.]